MSKHIKRKGLPALRQQTISASRKGFCSKALSEQSSKQRLQTRDCIYNDLNKKLGMKYLSDVKWENMTVEEIDATLAQRISYYENTIKQNGGKHPKREGYIVERIAEFSNLMQASEEAQKGKGKKRYVRRHNRNKEKDLRDIQLMILTLKFPPLKFREEDQKTDNGKIRRIVKQNFVPWCILYRAIMRVLGPIQSRHLIHDTFACVKGKGVHFGVKRMKMMQRRYPEYHYYVKTDYLKFYMSIPHDQFFEKLEKRVKDKHLIRLLKNTLFSYDAGEEINQLIANEKLKKRMCNWSAAEPSEREFLRERDRSPIQGTTQGEMLPALL